MVCTVRDEGVGEEERKVVCTGRGDWSAGARADGDKAVDELVDKIVEGVVWGEDGGSD